VGVDSRAIEMEPAGDLGGVDKLVRPDVSGAE
jgi:hypothetical protein